MADSLQQTFGIEGRVSFQGNVGGLPSVQLTHADGSSAKVTLHGGHVVSWKDRLGVERLFMSKKAVFAPGKAIRGGIPIIFPQFGPGPLPGHGFARNTSWYCLESKELVDGSIAVKLGLQN